MDLSGHENQRQGKPEAGGLHFLAGETAEAHKGSGIGHDELGISQTNKCDEHADSGGRGVLQAIRHAIDNLLADSRNRENQEKYARKEDYGESGPPGYVHRQTY